MRFKIRIVLIALLITFVVIKSCSPERAEVMLELNQAGIIEPRVSHAGFGFSFTGYRVLPDGRKQQLKGIATTERVIKLEVE